MVSAKAELPSALVLAGGLGTRLPEVSAHRPKPMADVHGRPFLEYVIEHLRAARVPEVVLCIGYKAEVIENHFAHTAGIRCVREPEPLGTAGALRLALPYVGARALAQNGDSFVDVALDELVALHVAEGAAVTLAAVERPDASRFGTLISEGTRLLAFREKQPQATAGWINAGVYVIERAVLERIPAGKPFSFERYVLPSLLDAGEKVAIFRHRGYFEDIGVPEGLAAFRARAQQQAERSLG